MEPEFYSVKGYGDKYGPKKTLTYKLISTGQLEMIKIGGKTLISRVSAEALAERAIAERRASQGEVNS